MMLRQGRYVLRSLAGASRIIREKIVLENNRSNSFVQFRKQLHRGGNNWGLAQTAGKTLPLSLVFVTVNAAKPNMSEAIATCDKLYEAGEMQKSFEAIAPFKDDPNPEVQWRYARMNYKSQEKTANKEKAIQEGLVILRKNLEANPKCPNTHKWIAILLGSKDKHDSFKQQIEEAFVIKEHLLKSLEYNPTDGYTHHVLGKWCFKVTEVSWYQKKIAATLFANPPDSTYEEALSHFIDAEKYKPDIFNSNHLLAAKCLLAMGKKEEAAESLRKCIAQENKDADSKVHADEARQVAKKNSISV